MLPFYVLGFSGAVDYLKSVIMREVVIDITQRHLKVDYNEAERLCKATETYKYPR